MRLHLCRLWSVLASKNWSLYLPIKETLHSLFLRIAFVYTQAYRQSISVQVMPQFGMKILFKHLSLDWTLNTIDVLPKSACFVLTRLLFSNSTAKRRLYLKVNKARMGPKWECCTKTLNLIFSWAVGDVIQAFYDVNLLLEGDQVTI